MMEPQFTDYRNTVLKSIDIPFLDKLEEHDLFDHRHFEGIEFDKKTYTATKPRSFKNALFPGQKVRLKFQSTKGNKTLFLPVTVHYQYGPYLFKSEFSSKIFHFKHKPEIFESDNTAVPTIQCKTCQIDLTKFKTIPHDFQLRFNKLLKATKGNLFYHEIKTTSKYHRPSDKNEEIDIFADFFVQPANIKPTNDEYRLKDFAGHNLTDIIIKKESDEEFNEFLKRFN